MPEFRLRTMRITSDQVTAKTFDEAVLKIQLMQPFNDWDTIRVKKFTEKLDKKAVAWKYAMPRRKRFM